MNKETTMRNLSERQKQILKFLNRNPGASTNRIYVNTSPACIAQNRTRTMATYGWKGMDRLEAMGLVRYNKTERGKDCRGRPIYVSSWTLTPAGEVVVGLIPNIYTVMWVKGEPVPLVFE
jgi:hypothetical protein